MEKENKSRVRKPKVVPPAPEPKIKGISDKQNFVLIEFDGKTEREVPKEIFRDPGKTYFFKEAK